MSPFTYKWLLGCLSKAQPYNLVKVRSVTLLGWKVIGEYVKIDGSYYVIVMTGLIYYGVVTLRSRACSKAIVIMLEQECVSIVTGRERQLLIALYGDPSDIVEYRIGNLFDKDEP